MACLRLFGLPICRFRFCSEPKPVLGDQKPGVDIFRRPSLSSSLQAILRKLTVLAGRHNTHLKNHLRKNGGR